MIKQGKLSATRDPVTGGWLVEPVELHRLYPAAHREPDELARHSAPRSAELEGLRALLADKDEVIADLRRRLDEATALLTDQRSPGVRRSWWRRMFTTGAVVVAVMVTGEVARADVWVSTFERTGNQFYEECAKPALRGYCTGFVVGIADGMLAGGVIASIDPHTFCLPSEATQDQVRDVALQFLTQHPELRQYIPAYLVARALSEAFPCSK